MRCIGTVRARSVAELLARLALDLGGRLDARPVAVGVEEARQDVVDRDARVRDLAGDPGEERGQPGARAGRQIQARTGMRTEIEVMLTMRPKRRSTMPSMVA